MCLKCCVYGKRLGKVETWHVKLGDSELICNVDKKSKTEGSQSGREVLNLGGNYLKEK